MDIYDDGDYRKTGLGVKRTNTLLVRKPPGMVKPTTYNLPPDGFTYGRRDQLDDEGVREVVGSWRSHSVCSLPAPGRDFVRLNASAIANGATDSRAIKQWRATHDIRLREKEHSQSLSSSSSSSSSAVHFGEGMTFGMPSLAPTPIADVICNAYQRAFIEEQRALQQKRQQQQAVKQMSKQKGSSMHTRASLGHMKVAVSPPGPIFKLSRFSNVPSRIAFPGSSSNRSGSAPSRSHSQSLSSSQLSQSQSPSSSSFSPSSSRDNYNGDYVPPSYAQQVEDALQDQQ